jgi:hypothetical protein
MYLFRQQLLRTFADPFRHLRPHEAAVIQKVLQKAQVGIAQTPAQEEVIAGWFKKGQFRVTLAA